MTADKSAAAWHPGDGPVKPLDLDAAQQLRADLQARADFHSKSTDPWWRGFAQAQRDLVGELGPVIAALAAETARADQWSRIAANLERVIVNEVFDDEDGNGLVPVDPLMDALRDVQGANDEVARLRALIKDAPHDEPRDGDDGHGCQVYITGTCTCWKSAAPTTGQ